MQISGAIFMQPFLARHIRRIRFPDEAVRTLQDFEAYARQFGRSSYHPKCTCNIGTGGKSVVDPQLRVHGIDGFRICDSLGMPSLIG